MYIEREIEKTIDAMLAQGKVVLVTGARQVGKTTTLKHHLKSTFNYVTMDDPRERALAKQDSTLFFDSKKLPLIIDEVQRAPELFLPIKFIVDQSKEKGRIVLAGSQTYHLMKGISESLAGRVKILQMPSLNLRELSKNANKPHPYIPSKLDTSFSRPKSDINIWEVIHHGSMPQLQDNTISWDSFYNDYVSTYIERDVRDLINVKDETKFYNFMVACAARTAQLFNASEIAASIGVDHKTVQAWLSVLQASNIIHIVQPFWPNIDKRLTKMPKIFFMDTGLACHLTRWTTAKQLERGAIAGHMFETFAVSEILKTYMNSASSLHDVWFYRDSKKREIDLVIQEGHILHPVEVKTAANIDASAIKNFECIEKFSDYEIGYGHVICQTREQYIITKNVQAVPLWAI